MKEETREDIALFRYNIIYPILHGSYFETMQQEYMEKFSEQLVEFPDSSKRHIRLGTLSDWLRSYRANGFDELKPKQRSDKDVGRSLTADQRVEALRLNKKIPEEQQQLYLVQIRKSRLLIQIQFLLQ